MHQKLNFWEIFLRMSEWKWCFANTNPWDLQKKMGFNKLNTPACEQAFNWINRF